MAQFGDFVIYVDESGDHGMAASYAPYPVFVLAFCIFNVAEYIAETVPKVQQLKFTYFGHDMVVLHERDIRKNVHPFHILRDPSTRESFLGDLNGLIHSTNFTIVAAVIRKDHSPNGAFGHPNPYHAALAQGLAPVFEYLRGQGQQGFRTSIVFESRGKKEDAELREEFLRITATTATLGMPDTAELVFASKQANSTGLQIADLVARPIGIHVLNPSQRNRAWDTLRPKIRQSPEGAILGCGLIVSP